MDRKAEVEVYVLCTQASVFLYYLMPGAMIRTV